MKQSVNRETIPPAARRAGIAGFVGTFIEYYDFGLYAVLAVYFAPQFFPADNAATSFLTGLAVYGAGFFARPFGAVVFGRIGDRRGRRTALVATVLFMGACSALIGLLPTFEEIGLWAPVLLVVLRLGQGLSAGAELMGAVTYVLESAPPSRRVFLASLPSVGTLSGGACGPLVALVIVEALGREAMIAYGWRIAFLLAIPLTVLAYVVRARLEDSPEFAEMVAKKEVVKAPLREVFRTSRRGLLIAGGMAVAANGAGGMALWFTTFLVGTRDLPASNVFLASVIGYLAGATIVPIVGLLTDRYGQRRLAGVAFAGFAVAALPVLWLIGTTTSVVALTVGMVVYLLLSAAVQPPVYSFIAEAFPRNVRFTGSALAHNIGGVLAAGPGPLIAGLLFNATGSWAAPAIWLGILCCIGFSAIAASRRQPVLADEAATLSVSQQPAGKG
ncbi:MFS transporter [Rhodococcus koreensis]